MPLSHIVDEQLPLELNFKLLKAQGLAYIQKHSSTEWSNLNPSDPGVTILEELCYAFTELGYCTDFPIEDVLTNAKGELTVKNQFFLPQEILTTSPITIADYTKYTIDSVSGIKNAIVKQNIATGKCISGLYTVFLQIDSNFENPRITNNPFLDAYYALNSSRNVGEAFAVPGELKVINYKVIGELTITQGYDVNIVTAAINQKVNNYVFPEIRQVGYDALEKEGIPTNTIFNGPKLKKGWITTESIQAKKDSIHTFEITKIIQSVTGVAAVTNISFKKDGINTDIATCEENQIIAFNFLAATKNQLEQFEISSQGKNITNTLHSALVTEFSNLKEVNTNIQAVTTVEMAPEIPSGNYRDIANYYSIQNTIPELYAVGLNATNDKTPAYKVAESRQLKGYLTLFDQVLTNQFSQLANVGTLFSFKNAVTGTPEDRNEFYQTKNRTEKEHSKYPAPYQYFSPTYFYKSLYDAVPNLLPLLKNNAAFDFGYTTESESEMKKRGAQEFKGDPYNSYSHGLMNVMENETVNLTRRNTILNHLLARHGVSPETIDIIIYTNVYSGNILKDKVIIKSLYLQNLSILSYNRTKGYDYLSANKLNANIPEVTEHFLEQTSQGNSKDFILDSRALEEQEKVIDRDLINYSTLELKLSLLLAIKRHYNNYIINTYKEKDAAALALWMINQRKGVICIELGILLQSAIFEIYIRVDESGCSSLYTKQMSYSKYLVFLNQSKKQVINEVKQGFSFKKTSYEIPAETFFCVETEYSWTVKISWGNTSTYISNPIFNCELLFIFPDFVTGINTIDFKQRVNYFIESELPLHLSAASLYINKETLETLIPIYVAWFNALNIDLQRVQEAWGDDLSYNPKSLVKPRWYTDLVLHQKVEKIQGTLLKESAGNLFAVLEKLKFNVANE